VSSVLRRRFCWRCCCFFQFGNEGAIGGWLALFLTQKIGMSPASSIFLLALYFAALLAGRILAQVLLRSVGHGRMLFGSVLMGLFGCLMLAFTTNSFGAVTGVLLCGAAFSAVLPLAFERIGDRFPYFRPGFSYGIFFDCPDRGAAGAGLDRAGTPTGSAST